MKGSAKEVEDALKGAAKDLLQVESTVRELVKVNETLQEQADSLKKENASLRSTISTNLAAKQEMSSAELRMTKKLIESLQMSSTVESLRGELNREQHQSSNLRREIRLLHGEVEYLKMMKDKK